MPSIEDRVVDVTRLLVKKLIHNSNSLLAYESRTCCRLKRKYRCPSALLRCVYFAVRYDIPLTRNFGPNKWDAPWLVNGTHFINALNTYPKSTTPDTVFQSIYKEISSELKSKRFAFIFTDGSKDANYTSYAVVKENGSMIRCGLLYDWCSNFTAELSALYYAIVYAAESTGKFVICTDSKACVTAIQSHHDNNHVIKSIQHHLSSNGSKIKVMWVPGHAGIAGNDLADYAAKAVRIKPAIVAPIVTKMDVSRLIYNIRRASVVLHWKNYNHHYSTVNSSGNKLVIQESIKCSALKPFIRLRLGHTKITHSYLLSGDRIGRCPWCNGNISINHILDGCQPLTMIKTRILGRVKLIELLQEPSAKNILNVYKFLAYSKLLSYI